MTVLAALAEARVLAESLMVDTCSVSYRTGHTTQDETTGQEVPVLAVRFTSKCRSQIRDAFASGGASDVGGRAETVTRMRVDLPVTVTQAQVGDVVEYLTVGAGSDPRLVGLKFLVLAPFNKTYASATRLDVEQVVS